MTGSQRILFLVGAILYGYSIVNKLTKNYMKSHKEQLIIFNNTIRIKNENLRQKYF